MLNNFFLTVSHSINLTTSALVVSLLKLEKMHFIRFRALEAPYIVKCNFCVHEMLQLQTFVFNISFTIFTFFNCKVFCLHWYFINQYIWAFSVTRYDYNGALKSHDLLKIQDISLVEILFVKKNPLQDWLSGLNAVISTNERH